MKNAINQLLRRWQRYRTAALALLATAMLVGSAIVSFAVPWQEVMGYLLLCLLGVAVIAATAALLVLIFKSWR